MDRDMDWRRHFEGTYTGSFTETPNPWGRNGTAALNRNRPCHPGSRPAPPLSNRATHSHTHQKTARVIDQAFRPSRHNCFFLCFPLPTLFLLEWFHSMPWENSVGPIMKWANDDTTEPLPPSPSSTLQFDIFVSSAGRENAINRHFAGCSWSTLNRI
jgi:hypothetical protein